MMGTMVGIEDAESCTVRINRFAREICLETLAHDVHQWQSRWRRFLRSQDPRVLINYPDQCCQCISLLPTVMEREKHKFKVLIVGGSIAGLVLANMLEQLGIDFLVLEGYTEIAPQVGASIAFHPNGCRILDQIGCYDGVRAKVDGEVKDAFYNSAEGKSLAHVPFFGQHLVERHGYGIVFIDRQMAIQVFYDNLKNKSKVLVNKCVVNTKPVANGVVVTTQDGSTYSGDILVGADGVHSTIQKEMWRLGDELSPGRFPKSDRTDIPCDYLCIFGISRNVPGFITSSVQSILGHNSSYLVIDGPGSRVYWFLFVKNEQTLRGDEIPRSFSAEECKALAEKHWNDPINESVKFGDLYEKHTSAVLTSIPEFVHTEWHLGRMILLGDSVHKLNPVAGQGGNNAIETAAALATELHAMFARLPAEQRPTDADISAALAHTQARRRADVVQAVHAGHQQQRVFACETPIFGLLARIVPFLGTEGTLASFAETARPACRLPMLAMPQRPRFEPYHDELPAPPLGGLAFSMTLAVSVFGGLLYIAIRGLHRTLLDSESGAAIPLPSMYLLPIFIIWTVEGYRNTDTYTFVSLPVLFGIAAQVVGIAIVAPLYFLLSVLTSGRVIYGSAVGRPVPLAVAKTVLPAAVLGYLVPVILAATAPSSVSPFWQQIIPILVAFHVYAAKRLIEHYTSPSAFDMYKNADVAPLQDAFRAAFGIAFFAHASTVYRAAHHTLLSPALLVKATLRGVHADPDFALYALTTALWSLYSVYELRRTGWATTKRAGLAAAAVLAGQVLVGPVATYAALWYWREGVRAGKANLQGRKG
ncbi:FAD binding domain-containing protein [Mycena vitilis]|nr:FAD binding domain-containing protein [Mycena vitilis]